MNRTSADERLAPSGSPANSAVVFRSVALFTVLYQFRLSAGELSDTAVFAATVFAAFAAAVFLASLKIRGKKINIFVALFVIALIPWAARAFIAMPRIFIRGRSDGAAVFLDSLLLNYDRNNFVSLFPFYWAAATTWFSIRSRVILRTVTISDAVLLIIFFSIARASDIAMYRWPVVMIFLFAGIAFLQSLALLFSLPPEFNLQKKEKTAAVTALLILVFLGGLIFLKPAQERASEKGGGLLEPKLFSFDFSQVLRLDSEISMNDDLVMIVKKDPDDEHILLRRSVMSGYNKKRGFFRIEEFDERSHPQRLPSWTTQLSPGNFKFAQEVNQEYFMVNFDAAAFIGMKEPVKIIPFENWNSSSFKSAYAVESLASNAEFEDLSASVSGYSAFWPGPAELGISEKEFAMYTEYGGDEKIRSFAEEITRNRENYFAKVITILETLKYGEYRYSLKPGIAPDGDQLIWFLSQTKKGYCTYYAFAMTLMLRSLGIPARIAAGFFIDPETQTFDYYPVRADMAHAWVEVLFPGCGWVEFDPTTEFLAEGEEFRFSAGVDPNLFERLMREILENRRNLRAKTGQDSGNDSSDPRSFLRLSVILAKKIFLPLLIILLVILFILIRCGFLFLSVMCNNKRKKAIVLWKHAKLRLRLAGLGRPLSQPESEWALRREETVKGTYSMYLNAAAARFAREYHNDDFVTLKNTYHRFSESYRENVGAGRRLLAWLVPPLALVLRPKPAKNSKLLFLLLFVFLANSGGGQTPGEAAQDIDGEPFHEADELYRSATEAEYSEFWERAMDLYREGSAKFPDDFRFPRALGNLYYNRSLYGLAWDEYRKAESINPHSIYLLLRLANTAGILNRDRTSVEYYEKVLAIDPENREAVGNLGWMYYKVHRLAESESLLLSAVERFGEDAELSMTLGTVYSNMYRYEEGKYWYQKSIALGESWWGFTAIAHYNLSILEARFHRYDLSMDEANASLDAQIRASGYLSRAELHMRRLDLEKAQSDYNAAREIDPSPLAKINLAQIYQISGRLEEARLYALNCLESGDLSWMMNYGIDPVRYKRDIYEILYKTYSGLMRAEKFTPCGTPGEKINSIVKSVSYRFYSSVYRKLYQKYSLAAGDAYSEELKRIIDTDNRDTGIEDTTDGLLLIDQFIQYYNAFETYPRRAVSYLDSARNLEVAVIPESEPSYNLEKGVLFKNISLTGKALDTLDPVWEREMISECYREFARRDRKAARNAAEELFALNRGALLQAGIGLPVDVQINFTGEAGGAGMRRGEKLLRRTLGKAGFVQTAGGAQTPGRYGIDITLNGSPATGFTVFCTLVDADGVVKPLFRTIPLRSFSRKDVCDFAGELGGFIFRVE